jgi:serine/threonine-protein kinase
MQVRINDWKTGTTTFVTELLHYSQGNFMYLRYILPAIEVGKLGRGGMGELPKGLKDYYRSHWAQMKEEIGGDFKETHEKVICVLAVMTETVSLVEVSDWTRIERREVQRIIQAWEPFLLKSMSNDEQLYRLYHASFVDFLANQVDLRNYSELVATAIEDKIERARYRE